MPQTYEETDIVDAIMTSIGLLQSKQDFKVHCHAGWKWRFET